MYDFMVSFISNLGISRIRISNISQKNQNFSRKQLLFHAFYLILVTFKFYTVGIGTRLSKIGTELDAEGN